MSENEPAAQAAAGERVSRKITDEHSGTRLDAFLAAEFPTWSRASFRRAIQSGDVTVQHKRVKSSHRLCTGEIVRAMLPQSLVEAGEGEDIPLQLLYDDEHLAVIDKPPRMVVHPGKGHWRGTLTAALVFHFEQLSAAGGPGRPGVVHRLDRDTSGAILIAKSDTAHYALSKQFHEREVSKEYLAICVGAWDRDADIVDQPIGPHPYQREKMAIRGDHPESRTAQTFFAVEKRYHGFMLVRAEPRTGRTHQIRVHAAHLGIPVLCDRQYGGRARITSGELLGQGETEDVVLDRQALHAHRLAFNHPVTGERLQFEAKLPDDMLEVLRLLEQRTQSRGSA